MDMVVISVSGSVYYFCNESPNRNMHIRSNSYFGIEAAGDSLIDRKKKYCIENCLTKKIIGLLSCDKVGRYRLHGVNRNKPYSEIQIIYDLIYVEF